MIEAFISPEGIKANWTAGARDPEGLSPDGWNTDRYFMTQPPPPADPAGPAVRLPAQPGPLSRVPGLPAPPPHAHVDRLGRAGPYFTVAGARAYLRDQPDAELHLLTTGHFVLGEELATIAAQIRAFYAKVQARAVPVGA